MADGIAVITHGSQILGNLTSSAVFLESKFFDLDGYHFLNHRVGNFEKTLTGLVAELGEGSFNNVSLYISVKQRLKDDAVVYGPFALADADEMTHLIGVEDGRFFSITIIDTAPQSVWQLGAIELYGSIGEGRV